MSKSILFTLSLIIASSTFSQDFTQANEPMIGEYKSMFLCDSFASDYAGTTGSGVTWNYSTLSSYVGQMKSIDVLASSTTPFASDFPSSTSAIRIEDFNYTFGYSTTNERISEGFVLENTDIGDIKALFNTNSQLLMNYPSSLGASVVDSFAGNLSFVYSGIPQNPACTGISYSIYDGIGTFLQPDGSALMNVSRYHFVDTLWTVIPVIGAAQIIRSQYEYYDLSAANHLPVFMHISAKLVSGFPDPLLDVTLVLSEVSGSMTASIDNNSLNDLLVSPNPAKEELRIVNLPDDAVVSLTDLSGRVIELHTKGNGKYDLYNLSAGTYILRVGSDKGVRTKTLIIE